MQVLYFLAQFHNSVLDTVFQLITEIGDETVFLVVAILSLIVYNIIPSTKNEEDYA